MDTFSTSSTSQPSTPAQSQKDGDLVRGELGGSVPSESQEKDPEPGLDGSAEGTEPVGGKNLFPWHKGGHNLVVTPDDRQVAYVEGADLTTHEEEVALLLILEAPTMVGLLAHANSMFDYFDGYYKIQDHDKRGTEFLRWLDAARACLHRATGTGDL